jgi:hypothetical protein
MIRLRVLFLIMFFVAVSTAVVLAQETGFTIGRWSFGSGAALRGGAYELQAIAGQAEGITPLSGGTYWLAGGFRPAPSAGEIPPDARGGQIYLPAVINSP